MARMSGEQRRPQIAAAAGRWAEANPDKLITPANRMAIDPVTAA